MLKIIIIIVISSFILLFSNPVYSKEVSIKSHEKYINKISNKFSRTYCNTLNFGISKDGALAFAIGETNKEFKNKKLNRFINNSQLKEKILNDIKNNCRVHVFSINKLNNLKLQ